MGSNCPGLCMPIKVPQPRNPMDICSPAVLADPNDPIAGYSVVVVPRADMILSSKDNVGGNCRSERADTLNHRRPRLTARLD